MNKARWVSATAGAAMVAATLVLPAAGVAYASGNGNVTGNGNVSVLSGNTLDAPISLPVNLCGVSLGIVGFANSGCEGGSSSNVSTDPSGGNGGSSGNGNVVGNATSALGPATRSRRRSARPSTCAACPGRWPAMRTRVARAGPVCTGNNCSPNCHGNDCGSNCHGDDCGPGCHGDDCNPPGCHGNNCGPGCHGNDCGPGCQGSHCAPGGNPGGNPNGTGPGTTTTVTNATGPVSGSLPTTGADLLLLGVAAVGTIGVGAGAVTLARRRRNGEAA